jgi:hypothetical protein
MMAKIAVLGIDLGKILLRLRQPRARFFEQVRNTNNSRHGICEFPSHRMRLNTGKSTSVCGMLGERARAHIGECVAFSPKATFPPLRLRDPSCLCLCW